MRQRVIYVAGRNDPPPNPHVPPNGTPRPTPPPRQPERPAGPLTPPPPPGPKTNRLAERA